MPQRGSLRRTARQRVPRFSRRRSTRLRLRCPSRRSACAPDRRPISGSSARRKHGQSAATRCRPPSTPSATRQGRDPRPLRSLPAPKPVSCARCSALASLSLGCSGSSSRSPPGEKLGDWAWPKGSPLPASSLVSSARWSACCLFSWRLSVSAVGLTSPLPDAPMSSALLSRPLRCSGAGPWPARAGTF